MIIVSFYTTGTGYEIEVKKLRDSLVKLGLRHDIRGIRSRGSWLRNCAHKSTFILEMLKEHDEPILWVDADAVVRKPPSLLLEADCDIAFCWHKNTSLLGGTLYFGNTELAKEVLKDWEAACKKHPDSVDQHVLRDLVMRDRLPWTEKLTRLLLPASYTKIFDSHIDMKGIEPVIEDFQASRKYSRRV